MKKVETRSKALKKHLGEIKCANLEEKSEDIDKVTVKRTAEISTGNNHGYFCE